ncbi:MAG TPA: VOC family protein [Anaerolineaceae bacterium]
MRYFNGICLITRDLPRLRSFYQELLQNAGDGDDVNYVFSLDGGEITLFTWDGMERMAPGSMSAAGHGGFTLEIEVEDVDLEYDMLLKRGVPVVKPPQTYPWGRRSVWFRDPDSNIINFYMRVFTK